MAGAATSRACATRSTSPSPRSASPSPRACVRRRAVRRATTQRDASSSSSSSRGAIDRGGGVGEGAASHDKFYGGTRTDRARITPRILISGVDDVCRLVVVWSVGLYRPGFVHDAHLTPLLHCTHARTTPPPITLSPLAQVCLLPERLQQPGADPHRDLDADAAARARGRTLGAFDSYS